MNYNIKRESPLLIMVALPFVYLAYLWNSLPKKVPLHWNMKGEIDGWGSKEQLIIVLLLLPVLTYVLLLLIPKLDPRRKLEKMGNKFYHFKFFMVLVMSLLAVFIVYSVQNSSGPSNMKVLYILMGFMIVGLGNYFPTIRPNYFIGIKTPWTLENETVWKETHVLGGKLWFFGGIALTLLILVLSVETGFIVFMIGIAILAIIPVVFSYLRYKALEE